MKRVLITGITGFTGVYAAAEMTAHGWEVWGLGSRPVLGRERYHCVDLADPEGLTAVCARIRPHAVLHLAALAFVGHGDTNAFYRVNLIGTRNLLTALAASNVEPECVLLVSSANVYGTVTEGRIEESVQPRPANDYAVSKLAMEHMARLWINKLPLVVTRPFNYTGVGQSTSFLVAKIADHFRKRAEFIELGNLDVWRDFSDVRSVAEVYRRLLETRPLGETVNICSGRAISLRDIIGRAITLTGHSPRIVVNPAFVRPDEIPYLCGDASKLRGLIGSWREYAFDETLRWMLQEHVQ
jgi:nucleoside-diphosphate-sugar epimerase